MSDDGLSSSFFITNLFRQKEKIKKPLLPKKAFYVYLFCIITLQYFQPNTKKQCSCIPIMKDSKR